MSQMLPVIALAPFLYSHRRMHPDRTLRNAAPEMGGTFTLWHIRDGSARVHRGDESVRLLSDQAILTDVGMRIDLAPRTRAHYIAFDLVDRPRIRIPERRWHPGLSLDPNAPPQPPLRRLFHQPFPLAMPDEWWPSVVELIAFCREHRSRNQLFHCECCARIHLWVIRYARALFEGLPARNQKSFAGNVRDLIRRRIGDGLTVVDLARALGMSRSALSRRFTETAGHGPGEAIERARIDRAKALLADCDLPIAEVAAQAGFTSSSAFGRAFKRCCGVTPGAWRRTNSATPLRG